MTSSLDEVDSKEQNFYMDQVLGIRYPFTLLFIMLLIPADLLTSLVLRLRFLPKDEIYFLAYIMRLLSIAFFFSVLRLLYYRINYILDSLKEMDRRGQFSESLAVLKAQTSFLNDPKRHFLAGFSANIVYVAIIYGYIFPVLKWEPYHVFSNAFWAGVLGAGLYVVFRGIQLSTKLLNLCISTNLFQDEIDELNYTSRFSADIGRFSVDVAVLSSLATGLWIGSIPYAFKYNFILLILCLGLTLGTSVAGYVIYELHSMIDALRRRKIKEWFLTLQEAKHTYEKASSLDEKVDILIRLFLTEFYLMQADKLQIWPVNKRDMLKFLGALTDFLPVILQYLLWLL
jgi:hypothetical protein